MEVASARVNCFERGKGHDSPMSDIDQFYINAMGILSLFKEILECRVGRLAAIRNVYDINENPGLLLARHFCKDTWNKAPLNRPENFELHAHKVFTLQNSFSVNSWVRNKTGNLTEDKVKKRIILIEQDLNTLAEEAKDRSFNSEDIALFFKQATKEFDAILNQYYPAT